MLLSLSTACFYNLPLRPVFRLAAEAGFEGVELVMAPEVWLRGPGYVRSIAREHGLGIFSVHQALMPGGPDGFGAGRMGDALRAALELGCPCVVIHDPGAISWDDPEAQRWLRALEACQAAAAGSGTRLALESAGIYRDRDLRNVVGSPEALAACARQYDLDITLDTCHAGTTGRPLNEIYALLKERVVNIHLSDLKRLRPALNHHFLFNLSSHHQLPGEGFLPLRSFLAQLAQDGFPGPITLETSFIAMRAWSWREGQRRLRHVAAYIREAQDPQGVHSELGSRRGP